MGEIVQFATGEEVLQALSSADSAVSGMSAAEVANALKLRQSGKMMSGDYLSSGGKVLEFPNTSASDAFNNYVGGGGGLAGSGAAASGASKTFNLGAGFKDGVTKALGVLNMSLPSYFAAIAPLLGVGVGVALYESSPDFWEKVSRTLLPFCYDDTEVVPVVVDAAGQIYVQGKAVDALKQLLDDLGIASDSDKTSTLDTGNVLKPIPTSTTFKFVGKPVKRSSYYKTKTYWLTVEEGNVQVTTAAKAPSVSGVYDYRILVALEEGSKAKLYTREDVEYTDGSSPQTREYYTQLTGTNRYYLNGHNWSTYETSIYPGTNVGDVTPGWESIAAPIAKTAENFNEYSKPEAVSGTILYGDSSSYYPEGSYKYAGNTPVDYTDGKIDVIADSDGNLEPYYPAVPPIGDPGVTNDPSVVPDPTQPTPAPSITPLIPSTVPPSQYPEEVPAPDTDKRTSPLPSPAQDPVPSYDPDANPSVKPQPVPQPEPAPTYPDIDPDSSPESTGSSPSDIFPLPDIDFPVIVPQTGSGLIHVYNPTPDEMVAFGEWLWVTYADTSIEKLWNNPFDGVISAHELYATPQTDGKDSIRSGFLTCPTTANLVRLRYSTIDCGSLVIPEYFQNYLDYSPYSKAHVYLPFIGIVELNVDDIVGHAVNIKYHVDAYNGSCIAQITVARENYSNTIYQYSGNCAVDLPLAGGSQSAIRAGMIMAAATGITTAVGAIGGAAMGLASQSAAGTLGAAVGVGETVTSGVRSAVGSLVSAKSSVQHSGSFGASYGAMGIKKPYLIIHRPIQKTVDNYNKEYGFPAHKKVTIGSCTGYLRVLEVHVKSPTATNEEKSMIEEALKAGVFVT